MAEKKKDILDLEQLNMQKQDYTKIMLIVGVVGLVICLMIAFLEHRGVGAPGWNGSTGSCLA